MRHTVFIVHFLLSIVLSTTTCARSFAQGQEATEPALRGQPVNDDAAQALPPLRLDQVSTWPELKRVPMREYSVDVRVVDAADGTAIEGVEVEVGRSAESIRVTDANGIARFTSVKRRVGEFVSAIVGKPMKDDRGERMLWSEAADYSPVGWRRAGQPITPSGLILPASARSAPLPDSDERIQLQLDLQLDGVRRNGRFSYEQQNEFKHGLFAVIVPNDVWPQTFSFNPVKKELTVGPTASQNELAFVRISNTFVSFPLRDHFTLHVVVEKPEFNVSVGLKNWLRFRYAHADTDWTLDRDEFGISYILIRLSDARITGASAGHDHDTDTRKGWPVPIPAGQYAVVPGAFSGTKFHLAFFHAVREGIDLAQFGVPIITLNEANPSADLTIDAMEFIPIRRRVERALAERRARDAAAGNQSLDADKPAAKPEDSTDGGPTPPAPGKPAP
jgi:hypothetical protein